MLEKLTKKNERGFTLAELLVVVAIIAILVAVSIPIFTSQLEKSRDATDQANIRAAKAAATVAVLNEDGYADTNVWTAADDTWVSYYDAVNGKLVAAEPAAYGKSTKDPDNTAKVVKVVVTPGAEAGDADIAVTWE